MLSPLEKIKNLLSFRPSASPYKLCIIKLTLIRGKISSKIRW